MVGDWIKLHRKLRNSAVASNPNMLVVWINLLLEANWERRQLDTGEYLNPGELIIGQSKFATEIGLTRAQLRVALGKLEKCGNITTSVATKGTHVTISNWETYQKREESNSQVDSQPIARSSPDDSQVIASESPGRSHRRRTTRTKEVKKERTVPPLPPSTEQPTTDDDDGFSLEMELAKRGVRNPGPVANAFYDRCLTDEQAKPILEYWDANPEAWETGALVWRIRNSRSEWLGSEGWPPKSDKAPEALKGPYRPDFELWRNGVIKRLREQGKAIPSEDEITKRYEELFLNN